MMNIALSNAEHIRQFMEKQLPFSMQKALIEEAVMQAKVSGKTNELGTAMYFLKKINTELKT